MKHTNFFKKFGSKSKTSDTYRNSCHQNPVMEFAQPQPSNQYPYHPQPPSFHHQPQLYTQPIPQHNTLPLTPCSCQCHPPPTHQQQQQQQQQHVIQSPQQQSTQSNTCAQYRNGTLDSRMTDSTILMSSQISLPPSNSTSTLPAYHTINQIHTTVNNQSLRYTDNLYYNQLAMTAPLTNPQHHHQQPQHQPQQQQLNLQQQQQQQEAHFQQQVQQHNGHQMEDQRGHKQSQFHGLEQQMSHMTLQTHHVENNQQRHVQHQQQQGQQQQQTHHLHHQHQQQYQNNGTQQHQQQQAKSQPQQQIENRTPQLPQQQQYQNHQVVENELPSYCDGDLPLEGLCMMYESNSKELSKLASIIKNDISKLTEELAIIKRRELPDYSVSEARI